jgi:DNA polymerase III sliding clamp (beta) subunit (PCNA family)
MNCILLPVGKLRLALLGLGKVACRKSTLPILGSVLITQQNNQLTLRATDLETWVIYHCNDHIPGDSFSVAVAFKDLQVVVKKAPPGESIQIQSESGKVIARYHLNGTAIDQSLESYPVDDFPELIPLEGEPIPVTAECRQSILQAFECASSDETRYRLNGIYLDVSGKSGHYVVATDGRHLYSSNSFTLPLSRSVLIPSHAFWNWSLFRRSADDWRLRAEPARENGAGRVELSTGLWALIQRQIEGPYPNWRQVVPRQNANTVATLTDESLRFIMHAVPQLPDTSSTDQPISLRFDERGVRLFASSPDATWTELAIPAAKTKGTPLTIHLNRGYLLKAARFGMSRIEGVDRVSPLRFSEEGRQMVVMPLRVSLAGEPPVTQGSPNT